MTIKVIVLRDDGDIIEVNGCVYTLRAYVRQTSQTAIINVSIALNPETHASQQWLLKTFTRLIILLRLGHGCMKVLINASDICKKRENTTCFKSWMIFEHKINHNVNKSSYWYRNVTNMENYKRKKHKAVKKKLQTLKWEVVFFHRQHRHKGLTCRRTPFVFIVTYS